LGYIPGRRDQGGGHLETALDSFYFFNPMRQVSSFVWIQQVERLWFEYWSGSTMPPGLAIAPERCIRLPNGETPR